jgi:MFS family permease
MMSGREREPVHSVTVDTAHPASGKSLRFALLGLAGASIEWYDFFLYATASALIFPRLFFPSTLSPSVALIASFSTFAFGFIARPVGAVLFGHLGDRVGRKTAFATALVTMGCATSLIGLVPSYQSAGMLAPLALILLRLTQGLALGGQWGGATLLATESAPHARRGLYGGIAQAGVPVGVVLANLALLLANAGHSREAFLAYGWRIPFLCSIVLVGLGLYIHFRVQETAAFREVKHPTMRRPSPVLEALRTHPRTILVAAGAYLSSTLWFYILITYVVAYGTSDTGLGLSRGSLLTAVLIANVVRLPADILSGALSDRFGRRRLVMIGIALSGLWAFVLFPLMQTRSLPWIILGIGVGSWLTGCSYGPLAAMFSELFHTRVRYSAASIAYQLGAISGGGLAPIIASALYAHYHSNLSISLYIAAACALSLLCTARLRETRSTRLDAPAEHSIAKPVHA